MSIYGQSRDCRNPVWNAPLGCMYVQHTTHHFLIWKQLPKATGYSQARHSSNCLQRRATPKSTYPACSQNFAFHALLIKRQSSSCCSMSSQQASCLAHPLPANGPWALSYLHLWFHEDIAAITMEPASLRINRFLYRLNRSLYNNICLLFTVCAHLSRGAAYCQPCRP